MGTLRSPRRSTELLFVRYVYMSFDDACFYTASSVRVAPLQAARVVSSFLIVVSAGRKEVGRQGISEGALQYRYRVIVI